METAAVPTFPELLPGQAGSVHRPQWGTLAPEEDQQINSSSPLVGATKASHSSEYFGYSNLIPPDRVDASVVSI